MEKATKNPNLKKQFVKIGMAVTDLQKTMQKEFEKFGQRTDESFVEVKSDIAGLKEMTSERPTRQEVRHIINTELNKAAEVTLPRFDDVEEKLLDHENRVAKLETASS